MGTAIYCQQLALGGMVLSLLTAALAGVLAFLSPCGLRRYGRR